MTHMYWLVLGTARDKARLTRAEKYSATMGSASLRCIMELQNAVPNQHMDLVTRRLNVKKQWCFGCDRKDGKEGRDLFRVVPHALELHPGLGQWIASSPPQTLETESVWTPTGYQGSHFTWQLPGMPQPGFVSTTHLMPHLNHLSLGLLFMASLCHPTAFLAMSSGSLTLLTGPL